MRQNIFYRCHVNDEAQDKKLPINTKLGRELAYFFCALFLISTPSWAGIKPTQEKIQPLLFDALKNQRFSAAYRKVFDSYLKLKWVSLGVGPNKLAEEKTLTNGATVYLYSTCRPHACDKEYLYFAYEPVSGSGWGVLNIQSDLDESSLLSPEVNNILLHELGDKK